MTANGSVGEMQVAEVGWPDSALVNRARRDPRLGKLVAAIQAYRAELSETRATEACSASASREVAAQTLTFAVAAAEAGVERRSV
jgi:hypothetical protein